MRLGVADAAARSRRRERTVQQQYPLGAVAARPIAVLAAFAAPVYSIATVAVTWHQVSAPLLAVASVILITAASVTVMFSSSPLRAPFVNQSAVFVLIWATSGMVLGAASMWTTNEFIRDDWGPVSVAALLFALSCYRPAREIALLGALSGILAGFLALTQVEWLTRGIPPVVFVIVAVAPIAVATIGAATFAARFLRAIDRWRKHADAAVAHSDTEWIARSVQQDRVTILNRDVVPFFSRLVDTDTVTDEDRAEARGISASIRAVMIAEAERGWLDLVVEQTSAGLELPLGAVRDESRLAQEMSLVQRTAVRAFLAALFASPRFRADGFSLVVEPRRGGATLDLSARFEATRAQYRRSLAPLIAVLRAHFPDLSLQVSRSRLALQFSYDE